MSLKKSLKIIIPFVVMPAVVILGAAAFKDKMYAWLSLVMVALSQLLFFLGFEKKTIGTRRLVITAVMTALSVIGRYIFSFIPGFKPVTAIVIITAIWIGGETGFLVGSLSALISNFIFGQGPWTPFQMLSWGLIGLVAGYISQPLKRSRLLLAVYGAASGLLFSLVMDLWSVLWYNGSLDVNLYLAAVLSALPYTAVYALSNVIFLLLLGRPFGRKLERVKIKYGV